MGSNPGAVYWMDIFSHLFVVKIVMFVRKRPKINEKEAGVGPIKKNYSDLVKDERNADLIK